MKSLSRTLRQTLINSRGQVMVEYVVLITFCVLIIFLEIRLLVITTNNYVQGIYFLLAQSFP
ncbi:MAG: hypothetical protein JW774_09470 [Candidatus Aureabacteria bacterium]|nr:hypothetical protein [Candidatus Auribacterota bacterium]